MNNLSFSNYFRIKEMAVADFGKHQGKHINDIDKGYAWYLLKSMDSKETCDKCGSPMVLRKGTSRSTGKPYSFYGCSNYPACKNTVQDAPPAFMADDGSGLLSKQQVIDALKIRTRDQNVAPTSTTKPIQAIDAGSKPQPTSVGSAAAGTNNPNTKETDEDRLKKQIPAEKISDYQRKIDEDFSSSNKHLIINALAGTGKTTILKHLAAKYGKGQRWLYLVFNKANQTEAESSFPSGVVPKTSHSFMMDVIRNTIRENPSAIPGYSSSLNIEPKKVDKMTDMDGRPGQGDWFLRLVSRIQNDLPDNKQNYLIRYSRKFKKEIVSYNVKTRVRILAGLAKNNAIDPRDSDAFDKIKKLFEKHQDEKRLTPYVFSGPEPGPDFRDQFVELTVELLKASLPEGRTGDRKIDATKDFDDMLWHPSIHPEKLSWPGSSQYKVALVDEVQDFNQAQKIMLENLARNGIRVVAVGDPNQAIYGFRGADSKGFSNIESLLGSMPNGSSTHPLPVNYRSGKKIIDYVNRTTHVKTLVAGRDHDGEVNEDQPQEKLVSDVSYEWSKDGSLKQETAFISRNNAPLFEIAVNLLTKSVPFQILGSDFSDEIISYVYKSLGDGVEAKGKLIARQTSPEDFLQFSEEYLKKEKLKHEDKKEKEKYLSELEKFDKALIEFVSDRMNKTDERGNPVINNTEDICNEIKKTFKGISPGDNEKDTEAYKKIDKKKTVILTTAHRSKGLEFERVNIISNELFPEGTDISVGDEQEHNAKYVAYTRATHTLNISETPKEL